MHRTPFAIVSRPAIAPAFLFALTLSLPFTLASPRPALAQRADGAQSQEHAGADEPSAKAEPTVESLSEFIHTEREKRHSPGASVAIIKDGAVLLAKADGLASAELSVPATLDSVYQIGSTTKPFTATAIMMLVEDGELDLDDKLTDHVRDLPESWSVITVRHLLGHTSGIKNFTNVPTFRQTIRKDFGKREVLDLVTKTPLEFEPGSKFSYTNTGYFLLGMIIEEVSGQTYRQFLEERIFKPLGMTATRVNDLRAVIPNRAQGYSWEGGRLRNGEYHSPTQPFAAGSLVSTVTDLMKWDAAVESHKLITAAHQDLMWTPTALSNGKTSPYGMGWQTMNVNGHRVLGHGGGIPGFNSQYLRLPDDHLTLIVLTNSDSGAADPIAKGLAERLVPGLKKGK